MELYKTLCMYTLCPSQMVGWQLFHQGLGLRDDVTAGWTVVNTRSDSSSVESALRDPVSSCCHWGRRGAGQESLAGRHSVAWSPVLRTECGQSLACPSGAHCLNWRHFLISLSCVLGASSTWLFPASFHHGSLAGRRVTDARGPLSTNSPRKARVAGEAGLTMGPVLAVLANARHALRSWRQNRKVSAEAIGQHCGSPHGTRRGWPCWG